MQYYQNNALSKINTDALNELAVPGEKIEFNTFYAADRHAQVNMCIHFILLKCALSFFLKKKMD